MFFSVVSSLTRAELSSSISVFHWAPATVRRWATSARTRVRSVLSLSSASPLAVRCPTWAMAERSAATSEQTAAEGLGERLLAAELPPESPPDEQPAPSNTAATTKTTPVSPALMPETLPPVRRHVLTRAGWDKGPAPAPLACQ